MRMRCKKWARRTLLVGLIGWALLVLFGHPFFAVNSRSGGKVLVVEGWMHPEGSREAARAFKDGGYAHCYTTGTIRPFSYYLALGDTIDVHFDTPVSGALEIEIAGLPSSNWSVFANGAEVLQGDATGSLRRHGTGDPLRLVDRLRITAGAANAPPTGDPLVFIGRLLVADANIHALPGSVLVRHADGRIDPGAPTFADLGLSLLLREGIHKEDLTSVPTWAVNGSRTLSTAKTFTEYADGHGIERFDVATLGVHARRTWRMYQKARDGRDGVGIIALNDRWCGRWTWWLNYYGWFQMLKEVIAWPAPWLVSDHAPDPAPEPVATLQDGRN